jgi:hypothetical protein
LGLGLLGLIQNHTVRASVRSRAHPPRWACVYPWL